MFTLSHSHCPKIAEVLSTGYLNTKTENVYEVIQVHSKLFVNRGTFTEQISLTAMLSKFRLFLDFACVQRASSPRDIIQ